MYFWPRANREVVNTRTEPVAVIFFPSNHNSASSGSRTVICVGLAAGTVALEEENPTELPTVPLVGAVGENLFAVLESEASADEVAREFIASELRGEYAEVYGTPSRPESE